jgi:hypothetical protein
MVTEAQSASPDLTTTLMKLIAIASDSQIGFAGAGTQSEGWSRCDIIHWALRVWRPALPWSDHFDMAVRAPPMVSTRWVRPRSKWKGSVPAAPTRLNLYPQDLLRVLLADPALPQAPLAEMVITMGTLQVPIRLNWPCNLPTPG